MKTLSFIRKTLLVSATLLLANQVNAQDAIGNLFKSGPDDAGKLVNAYLNPLFKSLETGLNSGWTTSAKTKGALRFDVRATASLVFTPKEDQSYNLKDLGLTGIKGEGVGQTIFGNNTKGDEILIKNPLQPENLISGGKLPEGLGVSVMPIPQLQLTLGLPKYIDVSVRFIPEVKLGDNGGKINMFGFGTKIEPLPLIFSSKMKLLPFDVAIAANYSKFKYSIAPKFNNTSNTNQMVNLDVNGYSVDAILSKKLLFFTPFIALGYSNASSNIAATGSFEFDTAAGKTTFDGSSINFVNSTSKNTRATIGCELQFMFFKIYAAYTASKYNYFNGGIGIGIGK